MSDPMAPHPPRDPHEILAAQAQAASERWSKQCDDLRASAGTWGKGVLTVGTVIVGGFGLSNVIEVFPVVGDWAWLWAALTVACLIAMASASIWLAWRQSRASRTIIMSPDLNAMRPGSDGSSLHFVRLDDNSFTNDEFKLVTEEYEAFAKLNDKKNSKSALTVVDYFREALDIEKLAESDDPAQKQEGLAKLPRAAQIRAEVYATQVKAMARVVRRRTNDATSGVATMCAILLFIGSLVGVVAFSSYASSARAARSESVEHVKLCAEAAKALIDANQPDLTGLPQTCFR